MRARQIVRKSVVPALWAGLALIVLVSLFMLIRHSRAGSRTPGEQSPTRFERALSRFDRRWPEIAGSELPEIAGSELPDASAAVKELRSLSGRASSVWQHVSVLKRARRLVEGAVLDEGDYYRLAGISRRAFPWSSELAALAAYSASRVGEHREALSLLSLLDPDQYQALILSVYLNLPVEDRLGAWRGLFPPTSDISASVHDPVVIARLMGLFCERMGRPEGRLDWTINAAWFAFLDGRKNEALGLVRPLLLDAALPDTARVQRILELLCVCGAPEEALALFERSALRSDLLLHAELLWAAGRRDRARALWSDHHFSWHPVAVYNRARQAPSSEDRVLVDAVLEGDGIHAYRQEDWTSLRILAARLRGEGPAELREAALGARARSGGAVDIRFELEALSRMDQGRQQEAILASYWELVNARPDEALVWERAAWWMARYQAWDELSLLMRHAVEQGRDSAALDMYRGLVFSLEGDLSAARAALERAASGPQAWRALANRALLREAERSYRTALEDLLLASRLFPLSGNTPGASPGDFAALLLRIAALQEQLGSPAEALRTLQRARDIDPESLRIRQALDRVYKQKERSTRSAPLTD